MDDDFLKTFFEEMAEHLDTIERLLVKIDVQSPEPEELNALFRAVHSVKGSSSMFDFKEIVDVAHILETLLDKIRNREMPISSDMVDLFLETMDILAQQVNARKQKVNMAPDVGNSVCEKLHTLLSEQKPSGYDKKTDEVDPGYGLFDEEEKPDSNNTGYGLFDEEEKIEESKSVSQFEKQAGGRKKTASTDDSIRVNVDKIDQFINEVGELIITKAMIKQLVIESGVNEKLRHILEVLDRNTQKLQESSMSMRMMSLKGLFGRFPRLVRDLSSKLNKKAHLITIGEETEIDKGLIELLSDPLTHLLRNSLDHGIESPEKRTEAGKDLQGIITLQASHQSGNVVIEVADDGAGLDREKILSKAQEKGVPLKENMSDEEVYNLIFAPGFSTAKEVTEVSGRGVGMDVVKKNIQTLNGQVEIQSTPGQGSRFIIRLPLTLAIIEGITVRVGRQIYIAPRTSVIETLQAEQQMIRNVGGREVVKRHGDYISIVRLYSLFDIAPDFTDPAQAILIIMEADGRQVAVLVDDLVTQQEIVIKSLEKNYEKITGFAGATILGDGQVAFILDPHGLLELAEGYSGKSNFCQKGYNCFSCSTCYALEKKGNLLTAETKLTVSC